MLTLFCRDRSHFTYHTSSEYWIVTRNLCPVQGTVGSFEYHDGTEVADVCIRLRGVQFE